MIPIRVERLIMRGKEVDIIRPKQLTGKNADAFNLFTPEFLCMKSLKTPC